MRRQGRAHSGSQAAALSRTEQVFLQKKKRKNSIRVNFT